MQRLLIRPLPLVGIQFLLTRIINSIALNNPRIFARLGDHSKKRFLIEPVDMPFVLLLQPDSHHPQLHVRRHVPTVWDARISGSFMNLLRLVEAQIDGDALFFSRDLVVEGDTEAVVCLRNALDDLESNIIDEAARAFGRPGALGLKFARRLGGKYHEYAQ
jgi:predicted lipid carrier protein YhbT